MLEWYASTSRESFLRPKINMNTTDHHAGKPPRIVVIGSINMDLIVRSDILPQPGETHIGSDLLHSPGGKGANQAVAAARLGAEVHMIGRVGNDVYGDKLLDLLHDARVHTEHIHQTDDCVSGLAVIHVDADGENAITVVSGANGRLSPDDVELAEPLIAKADAVLMQLEVPLPTVCVAAEIAHRHNVLTFLDPTPAPPPTQALPPALLNVDWMSPNRTEAQLLSGKAIHSPQHAKLIGAELICLGIRNIAITLGNQGAVIVTSSGTVLHEKGFRVDVADTTAAGDAFSAAMAVARAENQPMPQAALFACACGALAATRLGAQSAMPTRSEVLELLQLH